MSIAAPSILNTYRPGQDGKQGAAGSSFGQQTDAKGCIQCPAGEAGAVCLPPIHALINPQTFSLDPMDLQDL